MQLLIVDDEEGIRRSLNEILKESFEITQAKDGREALTLLQNRSFDLVLSDQKMPNISGLELLEKVKEQFPLTSFILMTAEGSIEQAVKAIRMGADDYLSKPIEYDELLHRVRKLMDLRIWRAEKSIKAGQGNRYPLVGQSAFMDQVRHFAKQVSSVPSPVLILGPSGTGKEILARAIHESGSRAERPFVAINCASLNENLIESELFGHEKGAFTGAIAAKPGKFELADGGTLFLDEIGEMPLALQAKLLRVLQEKEFCRVGSSRIIRSDARILTATHRQLKNWVTEGKFREDLFFRLNVLSFDMLPLSQRKEEIPGLIDFFWQTLSDELGVKASLEPEARKILEVYNYPGNVRELRNLIERLIVLAPPGGKVDSKFIPAEMKLGSSNQSVAPVEKVATNEKCAQWNPTVPLETWLEQMESEAIQAAMTITHHHQIKAAELLGLNRGTLQYKLKKYGILKKEVA